MKGCHLRRTKRPEIPQSFWGRLWYWITFDPNKPIEKKKELITVIIIGCKKYQEKPKTLQEFLVDCNLPFKYVQGPYEYEKYKRSLRVFDDRIDCALCTNPDYCSHLCGRQSKEYLAEVLPYGRIRLINCRDTGIVQ